MVRVLVFAGSTRAASLNRKLAATAAGLAREAGAEVTLLELSELKLPLYDGDVEEAEGLPAGVLRLKQLMIEHDAFVLACPEYNGSLTPLLKNAIDWATRPAQGEAPLAAYRGKLAALVAASPGALGGLRGLTHVRTILSGIGVLVMPTQVALPGAHEAFGADGALTDGRSAKLLKRMVEELVQAAEKLAG